MTTKPGPEMERESDRYSLTTEQARDLTFGVMSGNLADQEALGDFLLLCRALAYSDRNEDLLRDVENTLMPYTVAASKALDNLIRQRLDVAKED
jgi:hypothetical protein